MEFASPFEFSFRLFQDTINLILWQLSVIHASAKLILVKWLVIWIYDSTVNHLIIRINHRMCHLSAQIYGLAFLVVKCTIFSFISLWQGTLLVNLLLPRILMWIWRNVAEVLVGVEKGLAEEVHFWHPLDPFIFIPFRLLLRFCFISLLIL